MARFNDGEKLLLAMENREVSEMRLTPELGLQFQVAGAWRQVGNRKLTIEEIRKLMVDLLGEDLANVVRSGKDVQTRYEVQGHGRFIVRANGRDGQALLVAIPADEPVE